MNSFGIDLRNRGPCESNIINCLSTCIICVSREAKYFANDRRSPGGLFRIKVCEICLDDSFKNVKKIHKDSERKNYIM